MEPSEPVSVADYIETVNTSLSELSARVYGEVTSVKDAYGPAVYFSIKDGEQNALLNCMIWRRVYERNALDLEDGMQVILTGTPEIYAPYGKFTFQTQTIELAGEGKLKQEYEKLKKKLTAEGIFEDARKRQLPRFPHKIGVITSRAGVVMQDFSTNIGRYGFEITLVDSRVEGKDAIHDLHAALQTMAQQDMDVVVIMRGGGSLESLQAFNNEALVRLVAGYPCPVITGIGHDADITLVQLVADHGASTPTAAAQKINESWDDATHELHRTETYILSSFEQTLSDKREKLSDASANVYKRFISIERLITNIRTEVQRVAGQTQVRLQSQKDFLTSTGARLIRNYQEAISSVCAHVAENVTDILTYQDKNSQLMHKALKEKAAMSIRSFRPGLVGATASVRNFEKQINAFNPENNLRLGYSLAYVGKKLLRKIKDVRIGERVEVRLSDGGFTSSVEGIE